MPQILLIVLLLALDQGSKFYFSSVLAGAAPVQVIPGFFSLALAHNSGAAFSLFDGLTPWLAAFSSIAALIIGYAVWGERRAGRPFSAAVFGLLLAGILGNLIDRMRLGCVVDFLDFYYGDWHWPTFNLADTYICVSVALIVVLVLREKTPGK